MSDGRPLRADALRNRRRLLDTARDAFAAEGVGVPLDEIARRAGVGPGTLYRHFPTKDALVEAVVHDRLLGLLAEARAQADAADPGDALFAVVARLVAEGAAKRDLVDALSGAGIEVGAAVTATAAELRAEIARLLERAQRAGSVRAQITAADLMALISGVLLALRTRPDDPGGPADAGRLVAVLVGGLAVPGRVRAS